MFTGTLQGTDHVLSIFSDVPYVGDPFGAWVEFKTEYTLKALAFPKRPPR